MNTIYNTYNKAHQKSSRYDYLFYTPIDNYSRLKNLNPKAEEIKIAELEQSFYDSMNDILSMLSE